MGSDDEVTIQRILRYYNDLPFRVFREATPVQVLTAFHHLILRLHADLGFNFLTVNARTHQRFAKSMAALGLESYTPSLTSITRLDKPVLILAFNAVIDLIESRYIRSAPIDESGSVVLNPNHADMYATLPRPRSKRMSMVTTTSARPSLGLPKPRSKRLSMVDNPNLRPALASPMALSTPRRSLNLAMAPLRKSSVSTPLRSSATSLKSLTSRPPSPAVNVPSHMFSTPSRQPRSGRLSSTTTLPGLSSQTAPIQITPRAIKARLSLLPVNTPTSKIPALRQPRKPRPSVVPVIVPAKLPDGFEKIENPFTTKAKLKSTPVASRAAANRGHAPKVVPLQLAESENDAFETKPKIARTPDAPIKRGKIQQSDADSAASEVSSTADHIKAQGKLASLYNRFLLTDNDDNLPLRTIRKLIKAQKGATQSGKGEEEKNFPITNESSIAVQNAPIPRDLGSGDKENRHEAEYNSQKAAKASSAKDTPISATCEKRPVRRSRRQIVPTDDAENSEDDLVREASALLQRCELSDDEQSRKRAVNGRKLMEAIVTIRKSVAPRRRRKGK